MKNKTLNINLLCLNAFILLSVALAVGYRPLSVGADTLHYARYYDSVALHIVVKSFFEYFFELIVTCVAYLGLSYHSLFMVVALISSTCIMYLALKLSHYLESRFSYHRIVLLLFSLLFLSPFFFLSEINVIRQGTAIGLLFLVYLLFLERSWFTALFVAFIAFGFHKTVILYLLGLPLLHYLTYSSILRIGMGLSLAYLCNINQYILQCLPSINNKIVSYGALAEYKRGTRYDFVLFTVGIGIMLHFLSNWLLDKKEQEQFYPLLSIYWLLAIPFFIIGFGAYSDRYLLPAWLWLSVLATVFGLFYFKRFNFSIHYYFIFFVLSFIYFFFKVQGIIT